MPGMRTSIFWMSVMPPILAYFFLALVAVEAVEGSGWAVCGKGQIRTPDPTQPLPAPWRRFTQ